MTKNLFKKMQFACTFAGWHQRYVLKLLNKIYTEQKLTVQKCTLQQPTNQNKYVGCK